MTANPILKLEEIPELLVAVYSAETKKKTDKGVYENEYSAIKNIIQKYLDKFQKGNYTYYQDTLGNVYIKPNNSKNEDIVLSAHMDKVHTNGRVATLLYDKATGKIYAHNKDGKQTSLGADDKNGIFAILEIYRRLKADELPSVIFTVDEESGCVGSSGIDATFFEGKKHCIVIDRRNHYNLIYKGGSTYYGIKTPILFKQLNPDFEYEVGSCSDANQFCKYVDSMNVSCGYYNPHGSTEYTIVNELLDTVDAVENFILNAKDIKDIDTVSYLKLLNTYSYSSYSYGSYGSYGSTRDYYNDYYKDYKKRTKTKRDIKRKQRDYWDNIWDGVDNEWDEWSDNYDNYENYNGLDTCPICGRLDSYSKEDNECLFCGRLDEIDSTTKKKGDDENKNATMSDLQQTVGGQGDNLQQKK